MSTPSTAHPDRSRHRLRSACLAALAAGLVTLATGAEAASGPAREDLVGIWQFAPLPCASGYGMGLGADGAAWLDETWSGTWSLDGDRIVFDVVEIELGVDKPVGPPAVLVFTITDWRGDRFGFLDNAGQPLTAWRCPG